MCDLTLRQFAGLAVAADAPPAGVPAELLNLPASNSGRDWLPNRIVNRWPLRLIQISQVQSKRKPG
jgi:hypothetical protein